MRRWENIDCPDHRRSGGRLKKSWSKFIRHDLKALGLVKDTTQYRRL